MRYFIINQWVSGLNTINYPPTSVEPDSLDIELNRIGGKLFCP